MKNKLIIFDTTLRDGEQSPGASMTQEEKVRIAKQLEKLGVNVIEAGFAAASPGDFSAIMAVAKTIKKSTICSLLSGLKKISAGPPVLNQLYFDKFSSKFIFVLN